MQVDANKLNKIPSNTYIAIKEESNEDHIIKKRPTTGMRITADKLVNDVFNYAPKGMKGSKNSNFYEFLSLGLVPNLIGSATLILVSNALNQHHGGRDSLFAGISGRKMAAGVILYAAGKWAGNKIINKGIQGITGVDLEMPYKKVIHELPENKDEEGKTSVEFHKVFESADFPRWDLLYKQGEEKGDRLEYFNKIGKRMGYKEDVNSIDQPVKDKIKEIIIKATSAKAISSYIWAALGCAIASRESFGTFMNFTGNKRPTFIQSLKILPKEIWRVTSEAVSSLSKTKIGKGLMIGAFASSALGILNSVINFRAKRYNQTTVDYNKNYMEF